MKLTVDLTVPPTTGFQQDAFIAASTGIVHVGAHTGQEARHYAYFGKPVVWFEANPRVFPRLEAHIAEFPAQTVRCALLSEFNGEDVDFHLADNEQSSSLFDFAAHREMYPHVAMTGQTISLRTRTLDSFFDYGQSKAHSTLILDTQGSELLVLRGATNYLKTAEFIRCEAADFESYRGGCQLSDLVAYLEPIGFQLVWKMPCASVEGLGTYYEALFARVSH